MKFRLVSRNAQGEWWILGRWKYFKSIEGWGHWSFMS
jgi:hypothetical protein